jgi:hypothetical protein
MTIFSYFYCFSGNKQSFFFFGGGGGYFLQRFHVLVLINPSFCEKSYAASVLLFYFNLVSFLLPLEGKKS